MSKKHKKLKKKISGTGQTPAGVRDPKPRTPVTEQAPKQTVQATQTPRPAVVTATFGAAQTARRHDGLEQRLADIEFSAVRRDLRKLAATIVLFTAIIVGLTILNSQTTAIKDLGAWLFTWWQ